MTEAQDLRRRNRELEAASQEIEKELRQATEQVFICIFYLFIYCFNLLLEAASWRLLPWNVKKS